MALKDILVHLADDRGQPVRLRLAAELARRQQAQLTGIFGIEPMAVSAIGMPSIGSAAEVETMQIVVAAAREADDTANAAAEQAFRAEVTRTGIAGRWQIVSGDSAEMITALARCADLTVLGQIDPEDESLSASGIVERVLLGSGRPVLIVPYAGTFASIGKRPLIAWDATREAARAVGDALPLLAKADMVTVLSIEPASDSRVSHESAAAPLVAYLARHGISATASSAVSGGDISIGNLLLSRAADLEADLLVMGAYGHSPTRELILGGVTRTLLQEMTLPVLMSH